MKKLSWKTTSAGVASIIGGLWMLWTNRHQMTESTLTGAVIAILSGLGFVSARDNDKTSEDVNAK